MQNAIVVLCLHFNDKKKLGFTKIGILIENGQVGVKIWNDEM